MDFDEDRAADLRRYLDENEGEVLREVDGFYSKVKDELRRGRKELESEVDATVEPPNVCVFAPVELVRDDIEDVQISDFDYDVGREIGEAEFLVAMSLYLGKIYSTDFRGEHFSGVCHRFFTQNLHSDNPHWATRIMYYLNRRDFHEPHARFYPGYRSIVINSFLDTGVEREEVPTVLEPMYKYMSRKSGDPRAAILHEMTHLYIHEKSKFRKNTSEIAAINEAAAQSVSNVVNSDKIPSSSYYRGDSIDKEVMQAARQVFNQSTAEMNWNKAVSRIREEAVRSIDDVVDEEDPIRALREEDEFRSRMIRIVSYTIERTEQEVLKDVISVGFYSDELKERFEEIDDNIVSKPDVLDTCFKLEREAEDLEEMADEGQLKEDLAGKTHKVALESSRISSLVLEKNESPGPSLEEAKDVKILDQIIGDPDWTDPSFIQMSDKKLEEQLLNVLEAYRRLIVETYEASEELANRAKKLEKESRVLSRNFENERADRKSKNVNEFAKEIFEVMDSSRENLRQIEEMIEVAQSRMEGLDEDPGSIERKWREFKEKFGR